MRCPMTIFTTLVKFGLSLKSSKLIGVIFLFWRMFRRDLPLLPPLGFTLFQILLSDLEASLAEDSHCRRTDATDSYVISSMKA